MTTSSTLPTASSVGFNTNTNTTNAKNRRQSSWHVAVVVVAVVAAWLSLLPSAAAEETVPASHHAYGHVRVLGLPAPLEFFRGTFGDAIPCGARPLVLAPTNGTEGRTACEASVWEGVDLAGALVVVDRGVCSFGAKAEALSGTGIAGMILINSAEGLMRMPRAVVGPSADQVPIDFAVVMTRNLTRPVLEQAWELAQAQGLQLTGALEPTKLPCKNYAAAHPSSVAAAVAVSPTGTITSVSEPNPFNIDEVGFPKHIALTKTATLTFSGATDPDVPTEPVEVFVSRFGGIVTPGMSAPLSFPEPFHACDPLEDPETVAGTIAVVDRGVCAMVDKARFAQDAGAVGILYVNLGAEPAPPDEDQSLEGFFGDHVGAVMSYGDDREPIVHIAAGMVSREVAGEWRAMPDAFEGGVMATLTPAAGTADSWQTLVALRNNPPASWADPIKRVESLKALIMDHHPSSRLGNQERFAFLEKVAARADVGDDLAALVTGMDEWLTQDMVEAAANDVEVDPDIAVAAELAKNLETMVSGSPAHAFLTRKMSALGLDMRDTSVMDCKTSGGHFSMAVPKFSGDAAFATVGRLQELIRAQACLERMSQHVAAVLGDSLKKAKDATSAVQHRATVGRLMGQYGVPTEDVPDYTARLMAFAKLYDGVAGMPMSVEDSFEAAAEELMAEE